jgi:outer membrane protein OmpA-like peptidoglycan-associated protein
MAFYARPEFSKPGVRSFSPVSDAFAAVETLVTQPAILTAAVAVEPAKPAARKPAYVAAATTPDATMPRTDQVPAPAPEAKSASIEPPVKRPDQQNANQPNAGQASSAAASGVPDIKPAIAAAMAAPPFASQPQAALPDAGPDALALRTASTTPKPAEAAPVAAPQPAAATTTRSASLPLNGAPAGAAPAPSGSVPVDAKDALMRKCQRDVEVAAGTLIIAFEVNSAVISPLQAEQLKRFSGLLRLCPDVKIEVAGHTDLKGQQERNYGLSWQRAEAVISLLKSHGVAAEIFTPVGYGPRRPLSQSADTGSYNPVDRRVELIVR